MKLIFEFARIAAFCFAGEVCHLVLPLTIPASVYGLMLLLAALRFGVVKLEQVRTAALFLTGVILSERKLQINTMVITSTIAKLLIQPAIAWGIVLIFGLHGSVAITAILMIALSAGFFGVVFGNRFGVQSPDAEAVLLLSSVLCILSLPLFISLTSGL